MSDDKRRKELEERIKKADQQIDIHLARAYADPVGVRQKMVFGARVNPETLMREVTDNPHQFGKPKPGNELWRDEAFRAAHVVKEHQAAQKELDLMDRKRLLDERRKQERQMDRSR